MSKFYRIDELSGNLLNVATAITKGRAFLHLDGEKFGFMDKTFIEKKDPFTEIIFSKPNLEGNCVYRNVSGLRTFGKSFDEDMYGLCPRLFVRILEEEGMSLKVHTSENGEPKGWRAKYEFPMKEQEFEVCGSTLAETILRCYCRKYNGDVILLPIDSNYANVL